MSYTCRVYMGSGFNTVNIPDRPSLLDSVPYVDFQALEVLQNRSLEHIDIRVTSYDQIKNADYCRVDTWYYFVDNNITMLSGDVARLYLIPDYWTSAGGVNMFTGNEALVLDGITRRVHVSDDTYGKWTEPDELLAPGMSMELGGVYCGPENSALDDVVVKSMIDLSALGRGTSGTAVAYTDATTGGSTIIPQTQINQNDTEYYISHIPAGSSTATQEQLYNESHSRLFTTASDDVKKGINMANSLRVTSGITAQVVYPHGMAMFKNPYDGSIDRMTGPDYIYEIPDHSVDPAGDVLQFRPYYGGETIKNRRLDYSEYSRYGLITISGSKCEYTPAQIYNGEDVSSTSSTAKPNVRIMHDPRTDGKPYFRYEYIDGNSDNFFSSAVEGLPWKQIPLVYEGAAGSALAQMEHNQTMKRLAYETDVATEDIVRTKNREIWEAAGQTIGNIAQATIAGSLSTFGIGGLASGAGAGVIGAASYYARAKQIRDESDIAYNRALQKYEMDRKQEFQNYSVATKVYSPTVQFPFEAELARDLMGNVCYVYRYNYKPLDAKRIDRLLTMYGYRVTKAVTTTDFTNRTYFNYIDAGITIGGHNRPRWFSEGISAQINSGVRIWHVLPSTTRYSNNPIAT